MGVVAESQQERVIRLGKALINTKNDPSGYGAAQLMAMESWAYFKLNPYPFFAFQDWRTETRGPLPKCLPTLKDAIRKSAKWLFGKPISIDCEGNDKLQVRLRELWEAAKMPSRAVRLAELGGISGGAVLKWSYDQTSSGDDVKIAFYQAGQEARLYYDPHDRTQMVMARLQYQYFDPADGRDYWHREEWTETDWVSYVPVVCPSRPTYETPWSIVREPDPAEWKIESQVENPFGIIPFWPISNIENESEWGTGDTWDLHRVFDRICLTFHLMDKSNQFDSEPNKVYIDAEIRPEEVNKPMAPGQAISIKSDPQASDKQARVELLEVQGLMRPAMMEYAKELKYMVLSTLGSVDVRTEDITNKGNLTAAVMMQIYAPLVESTNEKRKTYGDHGIAKFLERLCIGMKNVGDRDFASVNPDNSESFNTVIRWPEYFSPTPEESEKQVTTLATEVDNDFLPHERAVEHNAALRGIEDVEALKAEVKKQRDEKRKKELEDNGLGVMQRAGMSAD